MDAPRSLTERMLGAARLDVSVYEEVEHDETATGQAAIVVGIVAVAGAVGASASSGAGGILMMLVASFVGWIVWSGVTYLVGDKLLGGTATWGELLRTLGFAQAPGVLNVLTLLPGLGVLVSVVVGIWTLVTGIVAIRQALDFSTGKAIATALLSWLALMLVLIAIPLAFLGGAGHAPV